MIGSGGVSVVLGDGDGTFQAPKTFAAGAGPNRIVAGDFNGDGRLDLATGNSATQDVSVLLGNGDGTFQTQQQRFALGDGYPLSMVAADFNDDGRLDLALGTGADLEELLGNGDGSFQPSEVCSAGNQTLEVIAGDFNNDGRFDLAAASPSGISVLLGNGAGEFQTQQANATGSNATATVTGDFNGDGRLDLATANSGSNTVSVLLGDGDGTFQPQQTFAAGNSPVALVAGDFNGDGRLDLAVIDSAIRDAVTGYQTVPGYLSILLGNGDGTFQAPTRITEEGLEVPESLVAEDFNGDGRLDLALADAGDYFYGGTNPGGVFVLLGNGDGTFQSAKRYAGGDNSNGGTALLVAGDFNGDGRPDLATTAISGVGAVPNTVRVLHGNGDGTFSIAPSIVLAGAVGTLTAGDFNGDAIADLAVASFGYPSTVQVFLGSDSGTFQTEQPFTDGVDGTALATGDFNGDGIADLIAADANNQAIAVLEGNGDGTFQTPKTFAVDDHPSPLVAGDFNGDGLLDLALTDFLSNNVTTLLGNGDGTFVDPGQLATTPHATPLLADLNGDGTEDVLVVAATGAILYRQGTPGQPGSFEPPITINPGFPSRDITFVPSSAQGPLIASVDARDDEVSLYAWRDGGFVRLRSLDTGRLPVQVVSADLNGDGLSDLVVRNAGDGSLTVLLTTRFIGPINPGTAPVSSLGAGDPPRRTGCLRRPTVRYDGKRPARSRGHEQANLPSEHPAQPRGWHFRFGRSASRRHRVVRHRYQHWISRFHC